MMGFPIGISEIPRESLGARFRVVKKARFQMLRLKYADENLINIDIDFKNTSPLFVNRGIYVLSTLTIEANGPIKAFS